MSSSCQALSSSEPQRSRSLWNTAQPEAVKTGFGKVRPASFTVGAGAPAYAANGRVNDLDIQKVGKGFGINALAADRFKSRVNADFTVKGSGGGSNPLNLDASGVIADSELFGASVPRMDFATTIAGADMRVRALGQFTGLNPAVVSGNEKVRGEVTGAVDVNATLRNYRRGVTPEVYLAASGTSAQDLQRQFVLEAAVSIFACPPAALV